MKCVVLFSNEKALAAACSSSHHHHLHHRRLSRSSPSPLRRYKFLCAAAQKHHYRTIMYAFGGRATARKTSFTNMNIRLAEIIPDLDSKRRIRTRHWWSVPVGRFTCIKTICAPTRSLFIHYICTNKSTSGNRTRSQSAQRTISSHTHTHSHQLFHFLAEGWMHFDYRARALAPAPPPSSTSSSNNGSSSRSATWCACSWISAYHFATLAIALCKLIEKIECHWQRYRLTASPISFRFSVCVCDETKRRRKQQQQHKLKCSSSSVPLCDCVCVLASRGRQTKKTNWLSWWWLWSANSSARRMKTTTMLCVDSALWFVLHSSNSRYRFPFLVFGGFASAAPKACVQTVNSKAAHFDINFHNFFFFRLFGLFVAHSVGRSPNAIKWGMANGIDFQHNE